ncbi:MAG: hypothetical protein K2M05_04635 [Paramuribaculum sp.]|nr:hypothetical protein [Paramuribaculum sp.]MDE6303729.1 hypothetical protein [Paramuribaculum sp.]
MKKNLFCAAAAVCVAVAFAACTPKAETTEATEAEPEAIEVTEVAEAAEVVDSLTNDTTVVVEGAVEVAPAE